MPQSVDILIVPLTSDLDVTSVPQVRGLINTQIALGCKRVIINMAEASYVDSMGVALLFSVARKLQEVGGRLSLVNVSESIYRTLFICRLVDFVPVSGSGPKPPIPELGPSARPFWQGTMRVDAQGLSDVRRRLEQVLERSDLSPEEVFDLTLAGGEALGNAVDHACVDGVLCSLELYSDRAILEVSDCGSGFELEQGEDAISESDPEGLERGRGIKLMRMLADSVEIKRKPTGEGTVVRLVKLYTPIDMEPQH